MLQISRRADYAMRMMIELGMQGEGVFTSARLLSQNTGVPKAFLHKIMADLVKANLVRTYSGATGGVVLVEPLAAVNTLQILEAIEGPLCLNICLVRPHECPRDRTCPAHTLWGRLQNLLVQELKCTTLADLVTEAKARRQRPLQVRQSIPYLFPTLELVGEADWSTGEQIS